jgi:transcriptional regulator with XRE-family HTH domain
MMNKKAPNPTDVHVGSQIRSRRMALQMSQEKLADGLGLTFQQVQKYEKGTNRVGASRLHEIAVILGVPVSFFFDDAPHQPAATRKKLADVPSTDFVTEFLRSEDGHRLIKAFLRIRAPIVRRSIVYMVEAISAPRPL